MIERLVLEDSYQRSWTYWQAIMLEYWAELAAREDPYYYILTDHLAELAKRIQSEIRDCAE